MTIFTRMVSALKLYDIRTIRGGNYGRRMRVMKLAIPVIEVAIKRDIAAGAYPALQKAQLRLEAKMDAMKALESIVPAYRNAGGEINDFQHDLLRLMDKNNVGTMKERAYWGRMATDAWRSVEAREKDYGD